MDLDSDIIRQEAERWFAKRRDGVRPLSEEEAFERWLGQSEAHARAYAASERAWQEMQGLQAMPRMREAAAAAMRATAPSRQRRAFEVWKPLLVAAGVATIAIVGVNWLLPLNGPSVPSVAYSTVLGEQRTEQLADGTRVTLNTDTQLQVRYGQERRDIVLERGEAMFEVAENAERPFVVTAAGGTVTALGTRFQVREERGAVSVTLLEGSVEVAREALRERQRLTPGDQAAYRIGSTGVAIRQVDPATATAWTQGRLDFRATPLAEAIAEANRYSTIKLRLGDPALAAMPVSGSFRTGDNAGVAAAFAAAFPIKVARARQGEIVLMPQ